MSSIRTGFLLSTCLSLFIAMGCASESSDTDMADERCTDDPSCARDPLSQEGAPTDAPAADAGTPPRRRDAGAQPTAPTASGPEDGDPSKPFVSIPGVPCGPATGRGTSHPTVKIGGRDVVVVYPCAREGADVTFLFTLHGTLQESMKVSFTMNAGPFHRLSNSHNVIYVLPKAIGTQWGNGDGGRDLPHIYEVIDWVYATFGTKWNIKSMWAQGGSWGAAYLSRTLACDPKLEKRLKGVRLIVGGGCPRCSDRLSCIVAQQELEIGGGNPLTPAQREERADRAAISTYAMSKGCGAKTGPTTVGNTKHWIWPNCNPGWVYSYYMGPGQHADPWDMPSTTKAMEEMKSIER